MPEIGNVVWYFAGLGRPEVQRGATLKEVPFKDAYNMFPAIRKN